MSTQRAWPTQIGNATDWDYRYSEPASLQTASGTGAMVYGTIGNPAPSVRLSIYFTDTDQLIQYSYQFSSPVDMSGLTVTADIMLQTGFGTVSDPGLGRLNTVEAVFRLGLEGIAGRAR